MAVEEQELQAAGGESDDARAAHEAAQQESGTSPEELEQSYNQPSHSGSGKGLGDITSGGGSSGGSGGRFGQLVSGGIGRLKRNKGKAGLIGGGGLVAILVSGVIFFGVTELKLISVMKDVESHAFKVPQYTYNKRSSAWIKDAINSRYFTKDGDKISVQGNSFHEQILQSLGAGMYKDLTAGGGNLSVRNDPAHTGERIIDVVFADGTRKTYSTYYQKGEARSTLGLWVDDQTDGQGWLKRKWIKHRITTITGTKWHWLDPITQPYAKAKITMANQVAKYLISSSSTATGLAADLLQNLLGADDSKKLGNALQAASSDEANKLLASALVDKIAAVSSTVGTAIAFLALDCGINHVIENNTLPKIAQQKAEIEYMTAYAAEQSQSNQLMEGKTNATAVGAAESLLVSDPDKNGKTHDITESDNIQRSDGNPVPYHPTDDCNSTQELCNSKLPANALNRTAIGQALQTSSDITNSAGYKVIASFIPGAPGGITTDALCLAYGTAAPALSAGAGVFDTVASNTPVLDSLWGDIKSASQGLFNSLLHTVIEPVIPPIVDSSTTGPALGHAITIGGDLASQAEMGSDVGTESNSVSAPCYQESATDQANNDSMCAPPLSPTQAALLDSAAEQDDINNFKSSGIFTQLASLDTPYSALSRIVQRMPSTPGQMVNGLGTTMVAAINPRSWITAIAAIPSILTPLTHAGGPQDASTYIVQDDGHGNAIDQFKVTQYGYTLQDLNKPAGSLPNADRNVGCALTAQYRKNNPNEDIPECDQFEQDNTGAPAPSTPSPAPSPGPSGSAQQLAQQILTAANAGKISFAIVNSANSSDDSTAEDNIKDTANGQPAHTSTTCGGSGGVLAPNSTANIDPKLLQFIVDLSSQENFTINELVGGCHDESNSNHYAGKAVDFGCPFDPTEADAVGKQYGISDGTGETCATAAHYHYSIGGN